MNCGALILAAGASTRLGHPKQLVRFGSETLLDRSIRIATEAGCAPIVVVLGAFEVEIRSQCKLQDVLILSNPDWAEGMGTTLAMGARAFANVRGILVMTCDMPAVTAVHLKALASSIKLAASSYGGRNGVPAYFPEESIPELLTLRADAGAKEFLRFADRFELPGGEIDIDTPEGLKQARKTFG